MGNKIQKADPVVKTSLITDKIADEWKEFNLPNVQIGEMIVEGNNGIVYLGSLDDTTVILKELPQLKSDDEHLAEFIKETKRSIEIGNYDRIVPFLGVLIRDDRFLSVFKHLSAGNLENYLKSSEQLTSSQQYRIALDVALGMQFLHSKNIIHRDLGARNVLLNKESDELRAYICDFGISVQLGDNDIYTSPFIGPIRIAPPEALQAGIFSKKSDIWSYGVLLFVLYTRSRPYNHISMQPQVKNAIINGEKLTLEIEEKTIQHIFNKCIETNPELRPSFEEIVHDLQ